MTVLKETCGNLQGKRRFKDAPQKYELFVISLQRGALQPRH